MTIQHIVLLKAHEDVSTAEMDALMAKVKQLESIPEVLEITATKNINDRDHGYSYGAVMKFADANSLQSYLEHSEHQTMSVEVKRVCADILTVDFEH